MSMQIIIVGGGIIGCSTAYYLSRHPNFSSTKVILVEQSKNGLAQGASGKAGGLIARWAYPKELVELSWREHLRLAQEHNGKDQWGFRMVHCGTWEGSAWPLRPSKEANKSDIPDSLNWVDSCSTSSYSPIASDGDTAQVHPYQFTTTLFGLAQDAGVQLVQGRVTQIHQQSGQVSGVTLEDSRGEAVKLDATHVIVAAGAWSPRVWSTIPVSGTRAHSITIQPQTGVVVSPYALFTELSVMSNGVQSIATPEIYPRPDNEVYACGPGDSSSLPNSVDEVKIDLVACESIEQHVTSISPILRNGTVTRRQACFLPVASRGSGPFVGASSRVKGLYVATGHTCWGICNGPGTGLAISELIMDGKITSGNLGTLRRLAFV